MKLRSILFLALLSFPAFLAADIFRPAYLELKELGNDDYAVFWKVPATGEGRRMEIFVSLPAASEVIEPSRIIKVDGGFVERWKIHIDGGLVGHDIAIEGRAIGVTDVIGRVERLDGSSQVARLPIDNPVFTVEAPAGPGAIAWSYLVLGFEHILGGIDHLLFVLALLLIVKGGRRIILTVTAFTVAHSLTLAGATLGWVHVPGPPVEAIIALSIVFVAAEYLHARNGVPALTEQAPWIVAFCFGLLHGFGFAGALAEVGLPEKAIPIALLTFNIGVELGQLAFVAVVLVVRNLAGRIAPQSFKWVPATTAYAIGSVAAFWTIERVSGFWV